MTLSRQQTVVYSLAIGLLSSIGWLFISFLTGSFGALSSQQRSPVPVLLRASVKEVVNENKPILQKWHLPNGVHLLSHRYVFSHRIGTPIQPTIEGGIVNTTAWVSFDDAPIEYTHFPQPSTVATPHRDTRPSLESTKLSAYPKELQDDLGENPALMRLLCEAAKNGKLAYVLKQSQHQGLPVEVALVPMVESHYDENALSPKGALGAWQLMPKTAEALGLAPQNRTDFEAETDAALQYLQQLHQQFGNWPLAYAAYNAGPGRIKRALLQNPTAPSLETLDIPPETKRYVKALEDLNRVFSHAVE